MLLSTSGSILFAILNHFSVLIDKTWQIEMMKEEIYLEL